ncbi:MAG: choice-of-anchor tandem repeat GloVer-containing protein, partial [Bryobacteraceae bacterium]
HAFPYNSEDSQNFSPNGTVLIGTGGTLYATTQGPGSPDLGLAIALAPPSISGGDWTEYQIYSFAGAADGGGPLAGVVAAGGSLFGTTISGGIEGCDETGCGVVFQLSPGATHGSPWTESVLHTFAGSDGAGPRAALTLSAGGVLYGTTSAGGSGSACQQGEGGCGTVFQLTPPATARNQWQVS